MLTVEYAKLGVRAGDRLLALGTSEQFERLERLIGSG